MYALRRRGCVDTTVHSFTELRSLCLSIHELRVTSVCPESSGDHSDLIWSSARIVYGKGSAKAIHCTRHDRDTNLANGMQAIFTRFPPDQIEYGIRSVLGYHMLCLSRKPERTRICNACHAAIMTQLHAAVHTTMTNNVHKPSKSHTSIFLR